MEINLRGQKGLEDFTSMVDKKLAKFENSLKASSGNIISSALIKEVPKSDKTPKKYSLEGNVIKVNLTSDVIGEVAFSDVVDFRSHFSNSGTKFQKSQLYEQVALEKAEVGVIKEADKIFRREL